MNPEDGERLMPLTGLDARLDRRKVTVTCDEGEKETTFSVTLRAGEEAPSL